MRTWLYMPTGNKMEFEFTEGSIPEDDYANALAYTNRLLALGASVTAPGLEAGEQKEQVLGVVKRVFLDETENREIPVIDVFVKQEHLGLRWVFKYLNNDEQIAEFENATGLKIADMPVFTGQSLHRHEKPQLAQTYLIPVKRQCSVVRAPNPAYDPTAAKKKMQYHLIRWDTVVIPTLPPAPPAPIPSEHPPGGINPYSSPSAMVTPATAQNAANGASDAIYTGKPAWFRTPVRDCFGAVKTYILKEIYENNTFAMNGSLDKRGISVKGVFDAKGEWAAKPAGELIHMLAHRHDEELPQASGQ